MTDTETMLDKNKVRRSFDRSAANYDKVAVLQREVAHRMLERLDFIRMQPEVILDAGAGTGFVGKGLSRHYRKADIIELDISINMLRQIRGKTPWYRRPFNKKLLICADVEQLPVAGRSVDMLFSSLAIQWCNNLLQTFIEFRHVLRPGGLLMFTTFGPDTLKELRESWAGVDTYGHVSRFLDMHDIGDFLLQAGFAEPVMDVEHFTLTYPDVSGLMNDLRELGATNALEQRPRGLTGPASYRQMLQSYEGKRIDGLIPATYEVIYGHAWVPDFQAPEVGLNELMSSEQGPA
ncbi:MAG TPA: malonyl-[acyl-carrier protein] O-methyltransferase BioC [Gammaproteobacteria bacterium]|nr:malonyl-[acyl-carrier protein] O-methyltransferase BioC [Gammaproteobacteria bacterium]